MKELDVYLAAFDDAWSHKWESLQVVLGGVSDNEASWQARCYAGEKAEDGWPLPGTILWQVAHIAHCKRHYAAIIRARASARAPDIAPRRVLEDFAAEHESLVTAHAEQRGAIVGIGDDDLSAVVCGMRPLGEFLAMTIRHDSWHAAQIAVARRLYRARATE